MKDAARWDTCCQWEYAGRGAGAPDDFPDATAGHIFPGRRGLVLASTATGRAVTQNPRRLVARRPSSKQSNRDICSL